MTELTLEQRVAALEKVVATLQAGALAANGRWWEAMGPTVAPQDREAFDQAMEYGKYFRMTGRMPPDDWKPGDPIPEPADGAP